MYSEVFKKQVIETSVSGRPVSGFTVLSLETIDTLLGGGRGLTLPEQIGGQAIWRIVAGCMCDSTGGYQTPFTVFGIIVAFAAVMVLGATPPGPLPKGSVLVEPIVEPVGD